MIDFETIFRAGYTVSMANGYQEMLILDSLLMNRIAQPLFQTERQLAKYKVKLEPEKMKWLFDIERVIALIITEEVEKYRQNRLKETPNYRTPEGMLPNKLRVHPYELSQWGDILVCHDVYKAVVNKAYNETKVNNETKKEVECKVLWIIINSLEPKNKESFKFIIEERLNLLYVKGGKFLSSTWHRPPIGKEFEGRESKAWLFLEACVDAYQDAHEGGEPATKEQLKNFFIKNPVRGYRGITIEEGRNGATSMRKITWEGDSLYWKHFADAFRAKYPESAKNPLRPVKNNS